MGVNDIVCTYASVCIFILNVQSSYGLWVKQTVIKILSKLYNKRTRDQNGGLDGGKEGQMGKCVETILRTILICILGDRSNPRAFVLHVKQFIVSWLSGMCKVYGWCSQSFSGNV